LRREKLSQLRHAQLDLELAREDLNPSAPPPRRAPGTLISATDRTSGATLSVVDEGRTLECLSKDGKTLWRTQLGTTAKLLRQVTVVGGKALVKEENRVRCFDLMTGREEDSKNPSCPAEPEAKKAPPPMPNPPGMGIEFPRFTPGRIALVDPGSSRLAIDLRQRDGARPGMRLEVRRQGQRLGTILITEVCPWGSWAKPDGDLKVEQLQKGDVVTELSPKEQTPKAASNDAPPASVPPGDVPWYGQKFEGQDLVDVLKARLEIQKAKLRE